LRIKIGEHHGSDINYFILGEAKDLISSVAKISMSLRRAYLGMKYIEKEVKRLTTINRNGLI